jgi:hypothetical protein
MMFMPWLMMLFFAPLAAGLQLYYVAEQPAQPGAAAIWLLTPPGLSGSGARRNDKAGDHLLFVPMPLRAAPPDGSARAWSMIFRRTTIVRPS